MNYTTHKRLASRGWIILAALLALRASALAAPAAPMQAYQIVGAAPKGVSGKLRDIYAGRADVQISDSTTGQIIVHGSPAVQQEIARWLAAEGLTPPSHDQVQPTSLQRSAEPQKMLTQSRQLRHLSAKDFESQLVKSWGSALQSSQDPIGDVATFRFPPTAAGTTSLVVDRRTSTATVTAPVSAAQSWQRLLTILDSRPAATGELTQIIPLVKADPIAIRKAVSLLTQLFSSSDTRRKQHIGHFVSMLFQEGAAQPAGGAQPAPAAAPPAGDIASQAIPSGAASAASMEAIARINNVQIEILEDVIVVRGRKEDVDRVLQIIEQIELQSLQFRPEVEIYHLKHADAFAINDQITAIYNVAFSRQGLVTVVPLQRPNALLLIGRKENIPSLIELISKLDLPAPTDGEFKIFQLQHMSSIDAERTVRTFFTTLPPTTQTQRPGLGTRAIVIADYRSNSLLVQAAPRDMIEIARVLKELDVAESTITHEIRIFKLRNSIAATLAPILEEAITAAQATTQATAAQGAAGQQTPPRATPPAVSLQFRAIGPEGEQILNSGIMANVRVTADAQGNTLIVAAPPSAMGLMAALIEQLDRLPTSEAQIKVFTIRNGDATALAEMLQNLFGVPAAGTQAAQPGQGAPTAGGDSAIVPLRFSVDQRTNSIIASGNAGDLNVIYHILTRLDEGDIRQRQTAVYRLRNAPAQDVSNALQQLLTQQLTLIQIAPELVTPVETLDRQVIVVPEVVTNSLIVSATSRYFAEISRIIETLDRRPPMVVMQVVLAEVTLSDNEQFGVEWGLQDALMFDRSASATGNRFNFEGPGTANLPNDATAQSLATRNNVATQGLANFSLGRIDPSLGFGGLVLTASSESVSVLLRALEQSSRSQIISRPQIQTLDNLPAFVQVGSLVPRISGVTATNTAVLPIINDINVGLILQVTPRTSPDGTIVMQIYAEKSSVGPITTAIPIGTDANGNPILSPQIPRTLAQTTVSARSGQTVILGGLITKDLEEQTRRVPYLGDIPVLGRLFRFDTVSNTRTELLIILTPYLVTSEEQIEWLNARETERMSWCVADIVNIHGPVNISGNPAFNAGPTPLIFPDLQPGAPAAADVPHGPVWGPEAIPMSPFATPYPAGPRPYAEERTETTPRMPSSGPVPAPGGTTVPPVPAQPRTFPPGPMPYQDVPAPPPPVLMPPGPAVPPSGAGFGSSRRAPDSVLAPQQLRIDPAANPNIPNSFAPPNIQPAMPPADTGIAPTANFQYMPLPVTPADYQPAPPH